MSFASLPTRSMVTRSTTMPWVPDPELFRTAQNDGVFDGDGFTGTSLLQSGDDAQRTEHPRVTIRVAGRVRAQEQARHRHQHSGRVLDRDLAHERPAAGGDVDRF